MRRLGLALLIAAVFAPAYGAPAAQSPSAADSARSQQKAVAVLDFQNRGPSVELEPLRKALSRMLTTDLAAYPQVRLVARERIERLIGETSLGESGLVSAETAQKAGRALSADFLVRGTFAGFESGIRVEIEVFDVAAGQVVGRNEASGPAIEVLAIQAKLLQAVTKALGLEAAKAQAPAQGGKAGKPITLAVLYFQNLSTDAHLDPMEIGFADLLIIYLQDRQGVAVVEREKLNKVLDELGLQKSALAQSGSAPRIGEMLGAQVILLGSFLSVGDTLRFDAHLVAADTGALMRAVSTQGPVKDADSLLRGLADKAAKALAAQPGVPSPPPEGKTSLEALLHYSRGVALYDERRYTEAAEEYQRCLYLSPDNAQTMAKLANLYYQELQEYGKAAELFGRLMAGPNRGVVYGHPLAWSYYRLGQPDRQIAVLEGMLDDPSTAENMRADVTFWLGKAYDLKGNHEEAKRWYEAALEVARDLGVHGVRHLIRVHLAYYFATYGNDREASARQWEAIIQEVPRDDAWIRHYYVDQAIENLSMLYEQAADYERARRTFGQAMTKFPGTPEAAEAQTALARVAAAAGREDEAAEAYVKAADAAPQLRTAPEALMRAASLFSGPLGDVARGKALLRRAVLRYGRGHRALRFSDGIRELPRELAVPFEQGGPRPALIDEGHNEALVYGSGQHEQFGLWAALVEGGRWVHVNDTPLSRELLAGYSVLILNSAYQGAVFRDEEIEAIRSFISIGGGLLLNLSGKLSTGGQVCYLEYGSLMSLLGIGVLDQCCQGGLTAITMNPTRRALTGVNKGAASGGTALKVPEEAVIATCQGCPVLAALIYGLGRVIVSGLGSGLRDTVLESSDNEGNALANKELVRAAVEWLTGADDRSKVKDAFEAAARKLAMGDAAGALAALRSIAKNNPGTRWAEEAGLMIGDLLRSKGDLLAASAEYERLAGSAKDPQVKALARLNLARCHAAGGGPGIERAVKECWKIWEEDEANPWSAPALVQAGKWAFEAGDLKEAQRAFDAVMNAREHGIDKLLSMLWAAACREKAKESAEAARIYRAIADEFPAIRVPGDIPRPAGDRGWDVKEYARARAQELAP
jgi:tetratricopeptide (TPR) repeat protein